MKRIFSDEKGRFQISEITSEMLCSIETLELSSIVTAAFHGFKKTDFNKPDGFCVNPLGEVFSLTVLETTQDEYEEHVATNVIELSSVADATEEILKQDNLTEDYLFDFFMS